MPAVHAAALGPDQGWLIEHECFGAVFSKYLVGLDWKQAQCCDYVIDFQSIRLRYGSVGNQRSGLHESNGVHEVRDWVHAGLALSVVMLGVSSELKRNIVAWGHWITRRSEDSWMDQETGYCCVELGEAAAHAAALVLSKGAFHVFFGQAGCSWSKANACSTNAALSTTSMRQSTD